MKDNKTIQDVLICPHCQSGMCYECTADEIEFYRDSTGHHVSQCCCHKCGKQFKLYVEFTYSITKSRTL